MTTDSDSSQTPIALVRSGGDYTESDPSTDVPPGKLRMVITYLEMHKPPPVRQQSRRAENISILRANPPTVGFYRFLYTSVGENWLWYERNQLSDSELKNIIRHPKIGIYVLYVNGTPAGYSELDYRKKNEIELAYFGLTPDFIGRGLGSYFLNWSVNKAWSKEPERVWVHSCNFDSPYAIATYQKVGFSAYKQEINLIDDPRL